jgi:hypothetical protein
MYNMVTMPFSLGAETDEPLCFIIWLYLRSIITYILSDENIVYVRTYTHANNVRLQDFVWKLQVAEI